MLKPPSPITRSISNSRRSNPGPSAFGAVPALPAPALGSVLTEVAGDCDGGCNGPARRVLSSSPVMLLFGARTLQRAVQQAHECGGVRQAAMDDQRRSATFETRPPVARAAQFAQQEWRRG